MALLKTKKILIDTDFTKDKFFSDNSYLKTINKENFPTTSADIQLRSNQPIFYSINNVLTRLIDNDKFIFKYASSLSSQSNSVPKEKLINAFNQNVTSLTSSEFEDTFNSHQKYMHDEATVKLSSIENTCLKSDFSNFNESLAKQYFLKGTSSSTLVPNISLSNDIVVDVEFNDTSSKSSSYLMASVCNKKTGYHFKYTINGSALGGMTEEIPSLQKTPYIYRKWLSGLKEFFVYLPTTFTFYNEGAGRPIDEYHMVNLDPLATWIQIRIHKRHFNLNHIYGMQICPQSLPMQIHNENSEYSHFSDIMQPSITRVLPISLSSENNMDPLFSENTNYFTLYFTCYGTDAQAIKFIGD